ncbi:DNA polymerase III subunit delta [bacterium]|nr:DNA polymerase III subunit delta [bacterium]
MRLQDFKKCLSSLKPTGTFLLWGNETLLIDAIISKLKDEMFGKREGRSTNCVVLYARDCRASDVAAAASTHPLFGDKSLVIVHNISDFAEAELGIIKEYLSGQTPAAVLVLTDTISPRRRYPMPPHPAVPKGKARVIDVSSPPSWEFDRWVDFLLSKDEKRISPGAKESLRDNVGNNITTLAMEIEKLVCLSGDQKQINETHTKALLGRSKSETEFAAAEAVVSGDRTLALTMLSDLLREGSSVPKITALVRWQVERIWRGKEMLEESCSRAQIGRDLKVREKYMDAFIKTANRFRVRDLRRALMSIMDAQRRARSEKLDERTIAEMLLIALCKPPASTRPARPA